MPSISKITSSILALVPFVVGAAVPAGKPIQIQSKQNQVPFAPLCINAPNVNDGTLVLSEPCTTPAANRSWTVTLGGATSGTGPAGTIKLAGTNKCLDVKDGVNAVGTRIQIWTCVPGNKNQLFNVNADSTISFASSNKCLSLVDGGNPKSGSTIQLVECKATDVNEQWSLVAPTPVTPTPSFTQIQPKNHADPSPDVGLCVSAAENADQNGVHVVINKCNTNPATRGWVLPANGAAGPVTLFGNKCLDVTNGVNADGTKLQLWDCVKGNTNQKWQVVANSTINWVGTNKCVDLTNGVTTNGNQLQIWTCVKGNTNQMWIERPLNNAQ